MNQILSWWPFNWPTLQELWLEQICEEADEQNRPEPKPEKRFEAKV